MVRIPQEMTDRAVRGEPNAIVDILEQCKEMIYSVGDENLNGRYLLTDLFQDVCEATLNGISGFRGDSSIETWIYEIARRQSLSRLQKEMNVDGIPFQRKDYNKPLTEHDDVHYIAMPTITDIEEISYGDDEARILKKMFDYERSIIVKHILAKLEPHEEYIVRRYYLDRLYLTEISEQTGINYKTLHKRLNKKYLPKLKKELKKLKIYSMEDI
jgi:RNA polymerase sigma factor (sigma-70 family)